LQLSRIKTSSQWNNAAVSQVSRRASVCLSVCVWRVNTTHSSLVWWQRGRHGGGGHERLSPVSIRCVSRSWDNSCNCPTPSGRLPTHKHTHTSRITIDFLKQFTISLCVPDVYENTSAKWSSISSICQCTLHVWLQAEWIRVDDVQRRSATTRKRWRWTQCRTTCACTAADTNYGTCEASRCWCCRFPPDTPKSEDYMNATVCVCLWTRKLQKLWMERQQRFESKFLGERLSAWHKLTRFWSPPPPHKEGTQDD